MRKVVLEVTEGTHPVYYSKMLDGLSRLGGLELRVVPGTNESVTVLQVPVHGEIRRIALDVHDIPWQFEAQRLADCDLYLKRSYARDAVPHRWASKVAPLGLNLALRGGGVPALVAKIGAKRLSTRPIYGAWQLLRYLRSPTREDLELAPGGAKPAILFQTRVRPQSAVGPDDADEVNRERVELVERMRKVFRNRFVGGLYPDAFARERYPQLVTDFPSAPRDYIRWSKQFRIGIYTRGLNDSIAFKMAEYLASSKCIVSTALTGELPQPLEAGRHFLEFRTTDECVAHCDALLSDDRLAERVSGEAWRYYQSFVEPLAHVQSVFRFVAERLERRGTGE